MTRRILLVAAAGVTLAGCGAKSQDSGKRYTMQGEIKSLDPAAKTANINAGKIEGWMEAMTMEYPIKPDAEFAKLHVGDRIEATVVVNDLKYYVTDVKVLPKP
ncbi:MAG: copper-binding protein [Acidobacteriia bacterium]|nr:copper-binding protein [Terriglobia bacterium]